MKFLYLVMCLLTTTVSQGQVYSLLDILSHFGDTIPDIQPATANHYQVHGTEPNFTFENISRKSNMDDVEMTEEELAQFTWTWTIQGDTLTGLESIPFGIVNWNCNGAFYLILHARHNLTGAEFQRVIPTYVIWYDVDYPACTGVSIFEVFSHFIWEDYCCYNYQIAYSPYDLNGDNFINIYDILELLAQ